MLKKILWSALFLLFALLGIIFFNTFRKTSPQTSNSAIPAPKLTDSALGHLTRAIWYKTISYGNPALFDSSQFLGFRQFLQQTYPLMHKELSPETIEGYSLLYKWTGKDTTLNPIVLMAHQDVVPIEESTRDQWTVDPFAGTVKEGFIWGRGTTDDKINLVSICESVEKLLGEGYRPKRTVYLVFGHDEEIGGKGAKAIAARMEAMGIKADLLMDEGGIITKEKLPGMTKPVALLGTSEKGYLSLEITAQAQGGHSSMPEKETSVDLLSKALVKLRENPFPAKFTEPMQGLMEAVGPEMPFLQRMAFANPWLFKGLIASIYEKTGAGNAMLHTTLVPTIIEGGIKDNVVPSQVKATINLRLLPGDSVDAVIKKVEDIIGDKRVTVAKHKGAIAEASSVTSVKSFGYQKMEKIMKQSYPDVVTSPFLMIGATDSRHFGKVSSNIIKFSPMIDPIGFHGIDERVSLESYQTALWFYEQLLRNFDL
jgi:carboxypeptidase PM20D1